MEIYRPGSGPLRRSGNTRQDADDEQSVFTGYGRELDPSKKSDFFPYRHFDNPTRKKENFPRGPSKTMNGFSADNYSTFNLRRKQQKKTQQFYEPPNEWTTEKRPDRPRVNFVNPDDSRGNDDENWRAHKAPKVVSVHKVVKQIEEKPVPEKIISPANIIPSMVINTRVNTVLVQNAPEKVPSLSNRKREEKKVPAKIISSNILISYEKLPPRFRKKFCEDNHISVEEVESYLTNGLLPQDDYNKSHSLYQSKSQTLPPRSGKGRFNEPQRYNDQIFYRTNPNQLPPKTEVKKVQSTANSSSESSKRVVDYELSTKIYNNTHQESKYSNSKDDTEDNTFVNMKQSIESAVLLPSGTIVSLFSLYFFFFVSNNLIEFFFLI